MVSGMTLFNMLIGPILSRWDLNLGLMQAVLCQKGEVWGHHMTSSFNKDGLYEGRIHLLCNVIVVLLGESLAMFF